MSPIDLSMASYLSWADLRFEKKSVSFRGVSATGGSETPLPAGTPLTALMDVGTVAHSVTESEPTALVRDAHRYAQALAVLPIDPELDAEVDALVSSHVQGTKVKRPLLRKR